MRSTKVYIAAKDHSASKYNSLLFMDNRSDPDMLSAKIASMIEVNLK